MYYNKGIVGVGTNGYWNGAAAGTAIGTLGTNLRLAVGGDAVVFDASTSPELVTNGTDWSSSGGGIGTGWTTVAASGITMTPSIITGDGFTGNAQKVVFTAASGTCCGKLTWTMPQPFQAGVTYRIGVTYRSSAWLDVVLGDNEHAAFLDQNQNAPAPVVFFYTPFAQRFTLDFFVPGGGVSPTPNTWFEIDDVSVKQVSGGSVALGGKLGIGTLSPAEKLVVFGNSTGQVRQVVTNANSGGVSDSIWTNDAGTAVAVQLGGTARQGTIWGLGWPNLGRLTNTNGPLGVGTDGAFPLYLATNSLNRMIVDSSGNVGIGYTSPQATLDVNGTIHSHLNITSDGAIYANYQDVAEWVPVAAQLEAGTVVVLNREKSNEVTASSQPYDTTVAGVVSSKPGVLLGKAGSDKAMIATTGRVKVKVDAATHAVAIGDLLVTSDKSGFAMRSEPMDLGGRKFHQPGTIIGKALEPLLSGQGEILVLLSLQ